MPNNLISESYDDIKEILGYPKIPLGRGVNLNGIHQKSGRLQAIYRTNNIDSKTYWVCLCDCGNYCIVRADQFLNEKTKSCGCLNDEKRKETINKRNLNNINWIFSKKFNYLTPLCFVGVTNNQEHIVKCLCDCGNICYVTTNHLTSGHTKSCGCLNSLGEKEIRNILIKNNIEFTTQKTFDSCIFPETKGKLRFDFEIRKSYLIEYDGRQHFDITSGWNDEQNFLEGQKRDNFKTQWCKENNIPLIRIPYWHYNDLCLEDLLLETTQFRVV